ncbi:MAG: endonuclease/exonuclease/phosphatase family protein [Bacteriovoracaceae bacterium]|nr:endonuclease/exonuclease/phosphatase family protein [Bacteriovoracaceae bacterium]
MLYKRLLTLPLLIALLSCSNALFAKKFGIPKSSEVLSQHGESFTQALPKQFSMLVWNTYKGKKQDFATDFKKLTKDKDLILLQEVYLNPSYLTILNETSDVEFFMASSFQYLRDFGHPTGVITGSTAKTQDVFFQRSKYKERFIRTPKVTMFTKYEIAESDQLLLVVNIHALNFVSKRKYKHQLASIAKVIVKHTGPVIFAGDFNPKKKSKLKYLKKTIKRLGLTEVTFKKDLRTRTKFRRMILDYIFTRGIKFSNAKVWKDLQGSDHKALTVDIQIVP